MLTFVLSRLECMQLGEYMFVSHDLTFANCFWVSRLAIVDFVALCSLSSRPEFPREREEEVEGKERNVVSP